MSDLASLAKQAKKAEDEQRLADQLLMKERKLNVAFAEIKRMAEGFGLSPERDQIQSNDYNGFHWIVEVTPDLDLEFKARTSSSGELYSRESQVVAMPSEQLYWDLDPQYRTLEEFRQGTGITGGTYACYGLKRDLIKDLAGLGRYIERVEKARDAWAKKHVSTRAA